MDKNIKRFKMSQTVQMTANIDKYSLISLIEPKTLLIYCPKNNIKHLPVARDGKTMTAIYFTCFGIALIWKNFGNTSSI